MIWRRVSIAAVTAGLKCDAGGQGQGLDQEEEDEHVDEADHAEVRELRGVRVRVQGDGRGDEEHQRERAEELRDVGGGTAVDGGLESSVCVHGRGVYERRRSLGAPGRHDPLMARLLMCALALVLMLGGCGEKDERDAGTLRPVSLALDFQPNAVHAGIFTARDEGPAERRGLDLRVRTPASSTDSLKLLAAGRADLAVVDIHDLGLARERGADVVGVGAIVQRPLAAVIAAPGVRRPGELEGRRVGVTGLPSDDAVLTAVVRADAGNPRAVRRTTIGFAAVPSLVAGRVDAVVTFWNAEGVALRRRGVRTREFRVDDFGAPRYPELVLATTAETLRDDPELVRDTVAALADGTREAVSTSRRRPTGWSRPPAAIARWCGLSSRRWRLRWSRP